MTSRRRLRENLERRALGRTGHRVRILAQEERPVDPLRRRYSQIAWVIARMCASLNDARSGEPRWPLVPKLTLCVGSAASGLRRVVLPLDLQRIDQHPFRCRLAGERGKCHGTPGLSDGAGLVCPGFRFAVEIHQSPVGLEIGVQVCEVHVVAGVQDVEQRSEYTRL